MKRVNTLWNNKRLKDKTVYYSQMSYDVKKDEPWGS